jgi:DNA polymerase III alpha subunit
VTIDLATLPMDDQAVYDDLCAADTIGVFQVESRAQMNTCRGSSRGSFYDLVVEVAIIRPGRSRATWCIRICGGGTARSR